MPRNDGRQAKELRNIKITRGFTKYAEGSVLVEMGETKVICNATIENKVPVWLKGQGKGWITAEYSMLPRATSERNIREAARGKISGRTMEIQRLIGRTLRSVVDLSALGERTIWLDCDVIQADGGTRTASISGGFVALVDAFKSLYEKKLLKEIPLVDFLAAVSVGKVDENILLDLDYSEDSRAQVDMNVVMTASKKIVEIQGSAEEYPFTKEEMGILLDYAEYGIQEIISYQKKILGEIGEMVGKWKPVVIKSEGIGKNED